MVIGQVAAARQPERPQAAGQGGASPQQSGATPPRAPATPAGTSFQRLGTDAQALLVRAQGDAESTGSPPTSDATNGHVQHVAAVLRQVFAHLHAVQAGSVQTGHATSTTA